MNKPKLVSNCALCHGSGMYEVAGMKGTFTLPCPACAKLTQEAPPVGKKQKQPPKP